MVRIKHRYLLINILFPSSSTMAGTSSKISSPLSARGPTPPTFTSALLIRLIRDGVSELFGDYGAGIVSASLKIPYFSPATSTAIVRCPRTYFRLVWAALTFVQELQLPRRRTERGRSEVEGQRKCVFRVVRVSGTIRKAEEEVIRRARREIVRVKALKAGNGRGESGIERLLGIENLTTVDEDQTGIEDLSSEDEDMTDNSG